ncbi:MAG TPA: metal ABC transporter permease [Chlamydiales bacterium]|jgi:manganese/zinc/iron transport system permease protein
MNWSDYFTDPILRAPTIGCMLMCIASSLMGVILLLQKRLLLSETVSHAAYPGAVAGLVLLAFLGPELEPYAFLAVLGGALFSSWVGLKVTSRLKKKWKVHTDAALAFSLALFFGFGILLTSGLQSAFPLWAQQAEMLLFGQAATLTDEHLVIYGVLALGCSLFISLFFRLLQALLFDRSFLRSTRGIEKALSCLFLFSIVLGIRSVGVILVSGMLIAPAIAARQWSHRLKTVFFLSALFGALSGWVGNVLSVEVALLYPGIHLPTGPAIVLVGTSIAVLSLLFSPQKGALLRWGRKFIFHIRCLEENLLKEMWKKERIPLRPRTLKIRWIFSRLTRQGWAVQDKGFLALTEDGKTKAASIVRLHRLWELYLTEHLGVEAARVHRSAEEMEHILTPALEEELTRLLANPQSDPHEQPIPPRRHSL